MICKYCGKIFYSSKISVTCLTCKNKRKKKIEKREKQIQKLLLESRKITINGMNDLVRKWLFLEYFNPVNLNTVLCELKPREEFILRERFNGETLRAISKKLKYASPERVRQIEAKALRRLKHPSRTGLIKDMHNNITYEELLRRRNKKQWHHHN